MVSHTRASLRFDQLRTLNQPRPVKVACDPQGRPIAIVRHGRRQRIESIKDHWRLEDEWWRRPIHRHYYLVELGGGGWETLFYDVLRQGWYRQKERMLGSVAFGWEKGAVTQQVQPAGETGVR